MKCHSQLFGDNLKRLREKHGMTQHELGELLGYSEKSISKWECVSAVPDIDSLFKLAAIFHTSIDELFAEQKSYYLGIDGGGTKTDLVLTDNEQNIIASLRVGPCNPIDIGMDEAKKVLSDAIYSICSHVPLSRTYMFARIAGGISGNSKSELMDFFSGFGFAGFENDSDNLNIISAGLGEDDGISLILGTGICAWSKFGQSISRVGGWGYLIDDGGSAYNIGRDALSAYFGAFDGSGAPTALTELIDEPPSELLPKIYSGKKMLIASYAPLVFTAASEGDSVSSAILERNFDFAARLVKAASNNLPKEDKTTVVLAGGLTKQPETIRLLDKALGCPGNFELRLLDCEPVIGAVRLAMKLNK